MTAMVLVVAGTHGNECNAPWLLEGDGLHDGAVDSQGLAVRAVIGHPEAVAEGRRYCDRDLNRSFSPRLLDDPACQDREVIRARELLALHGPEGVEPALVAIDLHSTTAAMGNSLVVYGRRPPDLALAAALQDRLGLPVYLHEGDPAQTGYLVERWPCGLVIEVGAVPQGVIRAEIVAQTRLALEETLAVLAAARSGTLRLPATLVVHRHLRSLDLPRDVDGTLLGIVHPRLQDRDWWPLQPGDPLFLHRDGSTERCDALIAALPGPVCPVFINEAAYREKGIALSLTCREAWPCEPEWPQALLELARGL
ncbi:MAG: aspartoacylase [Cyanobacteriota bacterium]